MMILGIDPDLKGGVALINVSRNNWVEFIQSMPTYSHPTKDTKGIDVIALRDMVFKAHKLGAKFAVVEGALVKPQQSKKGPAMMGNIGRIHQHYGAIKAVCELEFTRPGVITAWPSVWKKEMGLSSDKEKSLELARELFPVHSNLLSKKKNVGLAEAMLLAVWGKGRIS